MINDLIEYFNNKKILILGFGKEGQSTYSLIRKYLPSIQLTIADQKENFQNNFDYLAKDKNVSFVGGNNYLSNLNDYDIIMKSPGISFAYMDTSLYINKIKSQLELLLEFFDNYTIGITGTKGKSTTSSLIYKVLKDQNKKSILLGNIGVPVFDYIDEIDQDVIIVLEMSSHQLEYMKKSPNIAILLNVFEEHLDHYESFDKYAEAKCNIYKYQSKEDYFLYNADNEMINKLVKEVNGKTYKVSFIKTNDVDIYLKDDEIFVNKNAIYNKNEKRNLVGEFNLNNIMFVLGVSEILKLDINKTIQSIRDFKSLPHRLEFVGEFDHVSYYDNSIGTIPIATIEAVKALKNVDTLIIGGMDRGIDYTELIEFLNKSDIRNIICMPKTGHDIAKHLNKDRCYIVDNMEEAVNTAKKVTAKGKSCLLSPAAASYGFFKNFEERGDIFKQFVQKNI